MEFCGSSILATPPFWGKKKFGYKVILSLSPKKSIPKVLVL
jgi:hypothetical protein